jgi:hypothetical protein
MKIANYAENAAHGTIHEHHNLASLIARHSHDQSRDLGQRVRLVIVCAVNGRTRRVLIRAVFSEFYGHIDAP